MAKPKRRKAVVRGNDEPENNSRKNLSARRAGCSFDGKLHAFGVSDACELRRVSSCRWLSTFADVSSSVSVQTVDKPGAISAVEF